MEDSYFVDLTRFPIEKFKAILKTRKLLPGRIILKEKLDERFVILKANGINFLADLLDALKSKNRLVSFSKQYFEIAATAENRKKLAEKLKNTNSAKDLTKAKFAVKDIEYCKVFGRELQTIEL